MPRYAISLTKHTQGTWCAPQFSTQPKQYHMGLTLLSFLLSPFHSHFPERKLQEPTRFGVRASKNHQIWGKFQKPTSFHVDSSNRRWPAILGRLTWFMTGRAHLSGWRGRGGTRRSGRTLWHAWPTSPDMPGPPLGRIRARVLSPAVDHFLTLLSLSSSSGDLAIIESIRFLRLPAPRRPRRASPPPGVMPSWGDGSNSSNEVLGVSFCSRIYVFRVRVSDLGFSSISLISVALAEILCTSWSIRTWPTWITARTLVKTQHFMGMPMAAKRCVVSTADFHANAWHLKDLTLVAVFTCVQWKT
jgi:hypothetical protein